jgi:hypothetical protein
MIVHIHGFNMKHSTKTWPKNIIPIGNFGVSRIFHKIQYRSHLLAKKSSKEAAAAGL